MGVDIELGGSRRRVDDPSNEKGTNVMKEGFLIRRAIMASSAGLGWVTAGQPLLPGERGLLLSPLGNRSA